MTADQHSADHQEMDWSNWSRPTEGDVRSPCPALNSLANHNILPHNGKAITKAMAVDALTKAYHLDAKVANLFATGGVATNPDHSAHSFDLDHLDKHGFIEHDVSLSREDIAFGSDSQFDKNVFDSVMAGLQSNTGTGTNDAKVNSGMTSWKSASEARYARVVASKSKHEKEDKHWTYGIKEAIASYGETALYLNLLGKDGVAPLQWVRTFFEEERLPYTEGWRPPPKLDQSMLNHGFVEMIKANEHAGEEARTVGLGTLEALKVAVLSLGASLVKIPGAKI